MGALQDNWAVYYFSLVSRVVAVGLFYSFGEKWYHLAIVEAATFVFLAVSMWFA